MKYELKKAKAIEFMKQLDIYKPYVKSFEEENLVFTWHCFLLCFYTLFCCLFNRAAFAYNFSLPSGVI